MLERRLIYWMVDGCLLKRSILLLFVLFNIVFRSKCNEIEQFEEYRMKELSKNMTKILDRITHNETYDKRLRPNYGGPPVNVSIRIHVSKLGSVSEVQMDFTLDLDIRQTWVDPRLVWKDVEINNIKIKDVDYMKSIWVPDTCFPNEKKAVFHQTTVNQTFLHLRNNGLVTSYQRITITAACPMHLHYFPMDTQICELQVESYGYTTDDIVLSWKMGLAPPVQIYTDMKLPTFVMGDLEIEDKIINLSTGSYSRLSCKFRFNRVLQFYWIQIYQPSILVVMVSWVAFWISRDSAPARVTLGITTVLTMTTLMSTTNQQMPKVSYVKAVDIYLVVCYIMVFAALVEYAAVSYSNKKKQDINKRKANETGSKSVKFAKNEVNPATTPITSVHEIAKELSQPQSPDIIFQTTKDSPVARKPLLPSGVFPTSPVDTNCLPRLNNINSVLPKKKRKLRRTMSWNERIKLLASSVDKYSRFLFPVVFVIFNTVYWIYYLIVSGKFASIYDPPTDV